MKINSNLKPDEVVLMLKELVGSDKPIRLSSKYSGFVKENSFRFTDFSAIPSFLCPVLKGQISESEEGTLIVGEFTHPWIGYLALLTFFIILSSFSIKPLFLVFIFTILTVSLFSYRQLVVNKMLKELNDFF